MRSLIDLHCHTVSSGHAYSTVKENIESAAEIGLKYLGISDHAPTMPGTAHLFHFYNMKVIPKELNGVRILKGIEANIVDYNGTIDVPVDLCEQLDYVIASLHPACIDYGTREENTQAVIKTMENKYVKIIAHPDDNRYPLNYEEIVKAAKLNNVLLEVNNSSLQPNGYRKGARDNVKEMLSWCKKYDVKIIMGSDSHICYDIGGFSNCINILNEVEFPNELVINYNEDYIKNMFNI